MEIETTDTMKDIHEKEWENLVSTGRIDGSYGWYKTLEDAGRETTFYAIVKENGILTAAACCRVRTEKRFFMNVPLLDVRPFYSKTDEQTRMLLKGLKEIQSRKGTKGSLFFSHKKERLESIKNQVPGSTEFLLKENMYIDIDFEDFEDYLHSLSGGARRSARNTLNRANRWGIKTVFTDEFSTWKAVAHRLQRYVCEEYNDYSSLLPEQFYDVLGENLKDRAELVLIFKDETPLAFGLALNSPTLSLYKVAGVDPAYKKYHGYFLIYYEGIRKAIERGQKRIYFGPSSYEVKEKVGCKREACFGLVKMENPLLNAMLKLYITGCMLRGKKL